MFYSRNSALENGYINFDYAKFRIHNLLLECFKQRILVNRTRDWAEPSKAGGNYKYL